MPGTCKTPEYVLSSPNGGLWIPVSVSQPEPERSAISEPERDPVLLLGESTVAPSTPSAYVPAGVPEPTPSATYVPRDVPQSVSQSQHTGEPVRESQRQPEPVRDPFGESFSGLLVFMF